MSSVGIAAGSTEDRDNRPPGPILGKVELIAGKNCDARETYRKAKDLKSRERNTEPQEPDDGSADRSGSVQKGGKPRLEMERSPAEKGKGQGGVKNPQDEKRTLMGTESIAVLHSQEERRESQCCYGNAGEGCEEGPKLGSSDPHEEK